MRLIGPILLTISFSSYCIKFDFLPCEPDQDNVTCTEVLVPENWKKQSSRKITLPVKIYESSNVRSAIFWLSGGPGQSNMEYQPPAALLREHDVVLVGFRGVDGITKLDCPEVVRAMRGVDHDLLSTASVTNLQLSVANCAARLQNEGMDLDGYTIEQVINDLEYVRQELGYEKIHLLSASYGTRIALLYAQHHPDKIERSVLIGANSPGRFVWDLKIIDEQIAQLSRLCANDPQCSARTASLENTFSDAFKKLPEAWLVFPIDPGKARITAFALLYHSATAAMAVDALISADNGDYSGIALMSYAYDFIMPDMMVWGDFFSKGFIDYDSARNYYQELESKGLGSPLSSLIMDAGGFWPTVQPGKEYQQLINSDVSTLILSGSLDFSTPAQIATTEILPFLNNGTQIIFKDRGHVGDLLYDSLIITGVGNFFESGRIKFDSSTVPFNFEPRGVFTWIAKGVVFILMIMGLSFSFLLCKVIKRFLRTV